MKKNPIYESLIDKSIGSMLSAIEIYNKPDFKYREETFAILAINSWELLLKARLLKLNNYRVNSIYCYKPYINKNGEKSKKKKILDRNRTNNPKSLSIYEALSRLAYIIHSGFISGYQNRYGDNLKPPTNVYHRMTA